MPSISPSIVSLAIASLLSIASGLPAQSSGEPPIKEGNPAPFPALGPANIGNSVTEVAQIEARPFPGMPASVAFVTLSVRIQNSGRGWDLMVGSFNFNTGVFTKLNYVDGLNTVGDEFAGTVTKDLLTFAYDSPTGARYATRTLLTANFGASALITGVPAGYVDTKLCYEEGTLKLATVSGGDIYWGAFSTTLGTVTGTTKVVSQTVLFPNLHSPEPVRDSEENTRAFLVCSTNLSTGVSDVIYASGKFAFDTLKLLHSEPSYLANGTVLGGTILIPDATPALVRGVYGIPLNINVCTSNCDGVSRFGGTLKLSEFTPMRKVGPPYFGTILLANALLPGGMQLPGFNGKLGLNPAGNLTSLPTVTSGLFSGVADYQLPTPPLPPGLTIYSQPVMVNPTTNQIYLGNTSVIRVL